MQMSRHRVNSEHIIPDVIRVCILIMEIERTCRYSPENPLFIQTNLSNV